MLSHEITFTLLWIHVTKGVSLRHYMVQGSSPFKPLCGNYIYTFQESWLANHVPPPLCFLRRNIWIWEPTSLKNLKFPLLLITRVKMLIVQNPNCEICEWFIYLRIIAPYECFCPFVSLTSSYMCHSLPHKSWLWVDYNYI